MDEWLSTPFPCSPFDVSTRVLKNPYSGKATLVDSQLVPRGSPYDWARCHAGSWIYRNKGYVWVAGPHRHHLPPCHWVKSGHTVGFVPIHPGDAKGAPPKNVKHGIIVPAKGDDPRERVEFKPAKSVKALNAAPKQFREVAFPTLARAGTPTMVTHSIAGFSASAKNGAEHGVETPLTPRSTAGLESHTVEVGRGGVIPGSSFAGNRGGTSSASGHASRSGSGGAGGHASSGGSSGGGRSSGGGGGGASGGGHSSGGGGGGGGGSGGGWWRTSALIEASGRRTGLRIRTGILLPRLPDQDDEPKKEHRQDCLCHQATPKEPAGRRRYGSRLRLSRLGFGGRIKARRRRLSLRRAERR